ncbi:MAG: rod shape-determining protein MreC [Verrucomicrobia bacterium]|nr:rod shape-determining protein MreC [Verrucomicrobiota bacterium]MBU4429978.1 rod shape-determining protein MreC [Verrucomicrobiota bacterium]
MEQIDVMSLKQSIGSLLAVGLLLIVLLNCPPATCARLYGGVRDALSPLVAFLSDTCSSCWRASRGSRVLAADNSRMAVEISRLRTEVRQLKSLERENAELRHLLGVEARAGVRLIAAQVTTRAIGGWWQMARLDKGLSDGVAHDLPVISAEGLVGRIVDVSAYTADVLFLVDPSSKVSAKLSRMDAFGIVRGQGVSLLGDPLCRMDFIIKDAAILPGDEVVSSGLGGVYPAGLVIGYVEKVYLDRSGLYQYADIVPAVDLRSLGFVFIILSERPAGPGKAAPAREEQERKRL